MKPTTVAEYLASLPPDRRAELSAVREVIRQNIPSGYREMMDFGAISWAIPLDRLPETYNKHPLCYVALGMHKRFNTLYLMGAYGDPKQRKELEDGFKRTGKKMDMGKSCLHFRNPEDLPLDTIGSLIGAIPSEKWIATYLKSRTKIKKRPKTTPKPKASAKRASR